MNIKKVSAFMSIVVIGVTTGVAIKAATSSVSYTNLSGEAIYYTLTLDSSNKVKTIGNTQYVVSKSGASLECSTTGSDYSEGWLTLASGQSFTMVSPLNGLEGITFHANSGDTLKLEWASTSNGYSDSKVGTLTSGTTYNFPYGNYFKITNDGSSAINITSVAVTYSCWADGELEYDGFVYASINGEDNYCVSAYLGTATTVSVPSSYNGHTVTTIGSYAFQGCGDLTTVTIPTSIVEIRRYAFQNCSKLVTANFAVTRGWTYQYSGVSTPIDVSTTSSAALNLRYACLAYTWERS